MALERAKPTMSKPKRVTLKQIAETNSQVIFYKLEKRVHKLLKMISGIHSTRSEDYYGFYPIRLELLQLALGCICANN